MDKIILEITKAYGMDSLVKLAVKIVVSIVIIIAGRIIIFIAKGLINKAVVKSTRINERKFKTVSMLCNSVISYVIYFVVICNILILFGMNATSVLAFGGAISVAIGLGVQGLIQDMVTGIFIITEDQFGVGDMISIEGYEGKVESIGLRTTSIRSSDGDMVIIPNGQIKTVINMSKGFNRALVEVSVCYNERLDNVIDVLTDEMNSVFINTKIDGLLKVPEVLGAVSFGDSGIKIRIKADCNVGENWRIERELRRIIKNRFDNEGIVISYPHTVVHIEGDK